MSPIQFIFRLILRFNLMSEEEYAKTLGEAELWYASIRTDKDAKMKTDPNAKQFPDWVVKFKSWCTNWYAKVLFAGLFIWAVRQIHDYMHPEKQSKDADDSNNFFS